MDSMDVNRERSSRKDLHGGRNERPAYGSAYSEDSKHHSSRRRRRGDSRDGGSRDRRGSRSRSRSREGNRGQRLSADGSRSRDLGGRGSDRGREVHHRNGGGSLFGAQRSGGGGGGSGRGSFAAADAAPLLGSQAPAGRQRRTDWDCSKCSTLNFARRDRCFGCGAPVGGGFDSPVPTNVLRVSGLRRSTTADQVVHALKAFAPVKDAYLAVHPATTASLRACYAEFRSVEHARHTLETVAMMGGAGAGSEGDGSEGDGSGEAGLLVEGEPVSVSYAAAGVPPASAAPAIAALRDVDREEEGRVLAPVSASAQTALKAFQGRQNAARLAKLEGAEAASRDSSVAVTAEAAAAAAVARERRVRVDTESGAGMGSLALPFTGGGGGFGGGGIGEGISGRGAMAVVTLGAGAGNEGAPPEVVCAALQKKLNPPDWPPPFEEAGAAYHFDGPSGYFYESTTGVYYDPRSKLYCKDMRWHSHTPGHDPPFIPVEQHQHQHQQQESGGAPTDHQGSLLATDHPQGEGGTAAIAAGDAAAAAAVAGGRAGAGTAGVAAAVPSQGKSAGSTKRTVGGWKKSSRLAFGFKGNRLAKPAVGVLGGVGSESSGDEDGKLSSAAAPAAEANGAGAAEAAAGGGLGVGGALAKKRQLQDVSKWNARKIEQQAQQGEGGHNDNGTGAVSAAKPLHIAPRRRQQQQEPPPQAATSYDPPAPLVPPLLPDKRLSPVPASGAADEARSRSRGREALGGGFAHSGGGRGARAGAVFSGRGSPSWEGSGAREGSGVSGPPAVVGGGSVGAGGGDSVAAAGVVVACLLCRRSFGSSEMLRKHEKKSKLHRDNLAAAAAAAREGGEGGGR